MGMSFLSRSLANAIRAMVLARRAASTARYDAALDAVNRLPRPLMALGAIGFFGYSAISPPRFQTWMAALQTVPEPVWWLVTGILGLHFGAREAHYLRGRRGPAGEPEREDAA